MVNPNSLFTGTGVAPFNFTVSLAQGDTVQFAVFSGPSLLDGTFDLTALEFNISGGAAASLRPYQPPESHRSVSRGIRVRLSCDYGNNPGDGFIIERKLPSDTAWADDTINDHSRT